MNLRFDMSNFNKVMQRAADYTSGYLNGFLRGKPIVAGKIANMVETMLGKYIDTQARANPGSLHHVYEWGAVGSDRLFNIRASVGGPGVVISSSFSQSSSVSPTSDVPFYNKAEIMEAGTPITIDPAPGSVLVFMDGGEEVIISSSVTVDQPGGPGVAGSFERTFDNFFKAYFSQSVLQAIGFYSVLSNPRTFTLSGGYGAGQADAERWLLSLGGNVE